MTKTTHNLIPRLAIPLTGLLLSLHLFLPEERLEASASKNGLVDSLWIEKNDGYEVLQEKALTKEQLCDHVFFNKCFEGRQVWAAFQMVRTGGHTVCLYFVDFRTTEEADWAKKQLNSCSNDCVARKAQVCGTVLAYLQAPPDTPVGVLEGILRTVSTKVG